MARKDIVEPLLPVVRAAGAAILTLRDKRLFARFKEDRSPVTAADLESEAIIRESCSRLFPTIPVIGEESAPNLPPNGVIPSVCLLVDPIDGTKEFIAGRNEFTVNIGLMENGAPSAGIILAPAIDRLFFASGPGAAFVVDGGGPRHSLCAATGDERGPPLILASRSHLDEQTAALIRHLQPCSVRRVGSSLKFALVASGEADIYPRLSPTMIWDSAAGQALVEAAGGIVVRPDGLRPTYGSSLTNDGFLVARTVALAENALAIIRVQQLHSTARRLDPTTVHKVDK
ncbi:3'(2'),5'-bisphosphate nucleotidase CysQ family protein [Sinorhizobium fredii]|uniref:3'(2'),5'-bisphosphate nucleotidase CysQ family protein n=1 Tax=Rhizobium fredii TaxID=380 RepID=UPI0035140FDE